MLKDTLIEHHQCDWIICEGRLVGIGYDPVVSHESFFFYSWCNLLIHRDTKTVELVKRDDKSMMDGMFRDRDKIAHELDYAITPDDFRQFLEYLQSHHYRFLILRRAEISELDRGDMINGCYIVERKFTSPEEIEMFINS